LYLTHGLILAIWLMLFKDAFDKSLSVFILTFLIILATYIFGKITEKRRYFFKFFFVYLYNKTLGKWEPDVQNPSLK